MLKLSRKSKISQILIDKSMEFDIIPDSHFPSFINTELKPLFIELDSFQNNFINFQLNRNTSNQHCKDLSNSNYLNLSEGVSPPTTEVMGILPKIL